MTKSIFEQALEKHKIIHSVVPYTKNSIKVSGLICSEWTQIILQPIDVESANQTALKKCLDKIDDCDKHGNKNPNKTIEEIKQIIQECWGELK